MSDQPSANQAKPASARKRAFGSALSEALKWLTDNGKIAAISVRAQQEEFTKICANDKYNPIPFRKLCRWLSGESLPQRRNWDVARRGLENAGLEDSFIQRLDQLRIAADHIDSPISTDTPDVENDVDDDFIPDIDIENRYPKLCYLNFEIPEQGCSYKDFVIAGELRFARMRDKVDTRDVIVGIKRASMLPITINCRVKPGSLFRPADNRSDDTGAAHSVFRVHDNDKSFLIGDQIKGETIGRFVNSNKDGIREVNVEIKIMLESSWDIWINFSDKLVGKSDAQRKIAEKWLADQFLRYLAEEDESLMISSCKIRWI